MRIQIRRAGGEQVNTADNTVDLACASARMLSLMKPDTYSVWVQGRRWHLVEAYTKGQPESRSKR